MRAPYTSILPKQWAQPLTWSIFIANLVRTCRFVGALSPPPDPPPGAGEQGDSHARTHTAVGHGGSAGAAPPGIRRHHAARTAQPDQGDRRRGHPGLSGVRPAAQRPQRAGHPCRCRTEPLLVRGPGRRTVRLDLAARRHVPPVRALRGIRRAHHGDAPGRLPARGQVALRRAKKVGRSYNFSPTLMLSFADALFAYIDELESLSREGFLEVVQSQTGEQTEAMRRRLLHLLLTGRPAPVPPSPSSANRPDGRFPRKSPWSPSAPRPPWTGPWRTATSWPISVTPNHTY